MRCNKVHVSQYPSNLPQRERERDREREKEGEEEGEGEGRGEGEGERELRPPVCTVSHLQQASIRSLFSLSLSLSPSSIIPEVIILNQGLSFKSNLSSPSH